MNWSILRRSTTYMISSYEHFTILRCMKTQHFWFSKLSKNRASHGTIWDMSKKWHAPHLRHAMKTLKTVRYFSLFCWNNQGFLKKVCLCHADSLLFIVLQPTKFSISFFLGDAFVKGWLCILVGILLHVINQEIIN